MPQVETLRLLGYTLRLLGQTLPIGPMARKASKRAQGLHWSRQLQQWVQTAAAMLGFILRNIGLGPMDWSPRPRLKVQALSLGTKPSSDKV